MSGDGEQHGGASRVPEVRLLFVCLGNICRSPTAEGVMRALVERGGPRGRDRARLRRHRQLARRQPARRARRRRRARPGGRARGHARQVRAEDFEDFDLVLAMDRATCASCEQTGAGEEQRAKVRLLREFDPASRSDGGTRRARPLLRRGGRLRGGARPRRRRPVWGCSRRSGPGTAPVTLPPGCARRASGSAAGDINEAFRVRARATAARRS